MKNNQIIIALILALHLSASVFCAGNFDKTPQLQKKPTKPAYTLTLEWPYARNYQGEKFTKQDFPNFDKQNFAIQKFHPITESGTQNMCMPSFCPHQPFSFSKIQESDQKYLSKYIERFDQDNHATTKDLWDDSGSCYKKSQTQYFSDLTKVHQKFNLIKALKAKNIVPSKTKAYTSEQVGNALSELLGGGKPTFYCSSPILVDAKGQAKAQVLRYIHILLDENLNATEEQYTLCSYEYCGNFLIPPIEY